MVVLLCFAGFSVAEEARRRGSFFFHSPDLSSLPHPAGLPEFLKMLLGGPRSFPALMGRGRQEGGGLVLQAVLSPPWSPLWTLWLREREKLRGGRSWGRGTIGVGCSCNFWV